MNNPDKIVYWAPLKYERLPNFCYWCACTGHGDRDYEERLNQVEENRNAITQYGAWLRANPAGKNLVPIQREVYSGDPDERRGRPKMSRVVTPQQIAFLEREIGQNSGTTVACEVKEKAPATKVMKKVAGCQSVDGESTRGLTVGEKREKNVSRLEPKIKIKLPAYLRGHAKRDL